MYKYIIYKEVDGERKVCEYIDPTDGQPEADIECVAKDKLEEVRAASREPFKVSMERKCIVYK